MNPAFSIPSLSDLPAYLEALREGLHSGMGPLSAQELAIIEESVTADPQLYIEELINGPRSFMVTQNDGSVVPMFTNGSGQTRPWTKWRITRRWLVDDGEFMGVVNIRRDITEREKIFNGNIGYGIRPSKQVKGYGHAALRLALPFYRELTGESRALLCCYADNIRSRKVIEHNGGKLYETTPDPDEPARSIHRFWADV